MNPRTEQRDPASSGPAQAPPAGRLWWRLGAFVVAVAALLWAARHFGLTAQLPAVLEWIRAQGAWGPVFFIGLYIVACVLFVPGSLLTLGAGALFGVGLGTGVVSIGATLGATASFLIGRFFLRDWVAQKVSGHARFAAIDAAVGREGWKIVGLLRLSPVFPFSLLNYGLGVTRVGLRDYVLASWLGMLPGTVMYVYVGSLLGAALFSGAKVERTRTPAEWALYGFGLIATVAVTILITRIAKKALAARLR